MLPLTLAGLLRLALNKASASYSDFCTYSHFRSGFVGFEELFDRVSQDYKPGDSGHGE